MANGVTVSPAAAGKGGCVAAAGGWGNGKGGMKAAAAPEVKKVDEAKEKQAWEEMLPEANKKTNLAEDGVAKAVIYAEMMQSLVDDLDGMKTVMSEMEQVVQEAQKCIGEARLHLNNKMTQARRFESDKIRSQANETLSRMTNQLVEAQKTLNPLKIVRQEYFQRVAVKTLIGEVMEKLGPAEVEVDHATELSELASSDEVDASAAFELVQQADAMATSATAQVNIAMSLIMQKKKNVSGTVLEELNRLEERCRADVTMLAELKSKHKETLEQATCSQVIKEAAEKVKSVEVAVQQAADAEAPFLMGLEELPVTETLVALKACEAATTSATGTVSAARMFVATKLIETKRMNKGPGEQAQAALKQHQNQLDILTNKLKDLKASMGERKKGAFRMEAEQEVAKAEKLSALVVETTTPLEDDEKLFAMSAAELQKVAEGSAKAEQEATEAIQEARKFINAKQIEARGAGPAGEVSAELIKFQTRLSVTQNEVQKCKKLLQSVDQRLAFKKVVEEISSRVAAAEEKVEAVAVMAQKMADQAEGIATGAEAGDAAPAAPKEGEEKKPEGEQAEGSSAKEDGAAKPAEPGPEKARRTVEGAISEASAALKSALRHAESLSRSPSASTKDAVANIRPRITQAQEKLDGLTASVRASADRVQATALLREASERVKAAEEAVARAPEAETAISNAESEAARETAMAELDNKLQLASSMVGGAKTDLAMKRLSAKRLCEEMKEMAAKELLALQKRLDTSTRQLADAKKALAEKRMEVEKKAVQAVQKEVDDAVSEIEGQVDKAVSSADKFVKGAEEPPDSFEGMELAGTSLQAALESIEKTSKLVLEKADGIKATTTKGPMAELRNSLSSIKGNLASLKAKCEKQSAALIEARKRLTAESHDAVVATLQAHAKKTEVSPQAFFKQLSPEGKSVSTESLKKFLSELEGAKFLPGQLDLALERYAAAGVPKVILMELLQDFQRCLREIAITNSLEVKNSKTLRKLALGELVEIVESSKDSVTSTGLRRGRCRAMSDGTEGWITLLGNQGTAFFERGSKPYYYSVEAAPMASAFESSSSEVRQTKKGEFFELLEGPRKEPMFEVKFLLCKAKKDGAQGRIYLGNDTTKEELLEFADLLVCKATITLTSAFDIKEGKSIRKLEVGETMEKLEEPRRDDKRKLVRIRVRTTSKQEDAWLTVTGNQGTAYVRTDERLYKVKRSLQFETLDRSSPSAGTTRTMEPGELIELLQEPTTEMREGASRVHVRSFDDASEGWLTESKSLLQWAPKYRCVAPTALAEAAKTADQKVVRNLDLGELLHALDGPAMEEESGTVLWLRVRADKDGAIGFATLKDAQGAVRLEPEGSEIARQKAEEAEKEKEARERKRTPVPSSSSNAVPLSQGRRGRDDRPRERALPSGS